MERGTLDSRNGRIPYLNFFVGAAEKRRAFHSRRRLDNNSRNEEEENSNRWLLRERERGRERRERV